jgi:hypothetical protein
LRYSPELSTQREEVSKCDQKMRLAGVLLQQAEETQCPWTRCFDVLSENSFERSRFLVIHMDLVDSDTKIRSDHDDLS